MNRNARDKHLEERLDAMLRQMPVSAGDDFTEETLKGIRAVSNADVADERLDALLSSRPVAASEDFTERVMAEVVFARQTPRRSKLARFAEWANLAAAAVITLTVAGGVLFLNFRENPQPVEPLRHNATTVQPPDAQAPEIDPAKVVARSAERMAEEPFNPFEMSNSGNRQAVPEADMLELAESLNDAAGLLDDDVYETFALLAN